MVIKNLELLKFDSRRHPDESPELIVHFADSIEKEAFLGLIQSGLKL